jgi:prepilin-type N-terminal cleavage/methylation domain-containing protein
MVEPMGHMAKTQRGGFSIIELVVAMTLLAIIAAITLPAVSKTMNESRVQRASATMAADFQRGFAMAAQRRSPVRISIDTAGKTFRLQNRTRDTTYYTVSYNSTSDLALSQIVVVDTATLIYPSGLAQRAMDVTVRTPNRARRITVTRAGQVRISTP